MVEMKDPKVIELLEKATDECLRGCTLCETKDKLINQALILLKQPKCPKCAERRSCGVGELCPACKAKCKTCGGSRNCPKCKGGGIVNYEGYGDDVDGDCDKCSSSGLCPDCKPEATELAKTLLCHLKLIIPNLILRNGYNIPPEAPVEFFTEVREATIKLDRQAEQIKDLLGDLDAECRVSQFLLAGQKKLQAKNKRLKKALGFLETTLLHSKTLSEKEFVALKDIIDQAQESEAKGEAKDGRNQSM